MALKLPVNDQTRISPYNINTISSRQVMRIKKNLNYGIYNQILQTSILRTVWQTVRRITNEILGVKGFIAVDLRGSFSNIFQSQQHKLYTINLHFHDPYGEEVSVP